MMALTHWQYIGQLVQRYLDLSPDISIEHDGLLRRTGDYVGALTAEECQQIDQHQNGWLTPLQRYQVLNWIASGSPLFKEADTDLSLLIFGRQQLEQWLERSHQAYPHFDFYLVFEYQEKFKSGFDDGVNFTMHWHPQPGAPMPLSETETDFPWRPFWDSGEMFWGDFPGRTKNDFDFTLRCHPDETSFTKPGWICEEGDWYTMVDERDADLMSVAQVLEHFAVQV